MRLNTLKAGPGGRKAAKRLGRGIGSGLGKTCGKGHKGQTARAGGFHKVGFEGGQMPLQRRVPKFGFTSHIALVSTSIRLGELAKVAGDIVDLASLKAANVVRKDVENVKVFASGKIARALTLRGVTVTKGAKLAIEAAGGKVEG